MMANLGMADTLILMVLALVVFGPRRLPQIGRQIGKLMYEFRKASNDFKFQMEEELRQAEEADRRKKEEEERQRKLAAAPPPAESAIQPAEPATSAPPLEPPTQIATDTPYPGDSTSYGASTESPIEAAPLESPLTTAQAEPESAPPGSAAPAPFEPPNPRIAPPSTGEKVAATRPAAQPEQQNLFADDAEKSPEPVAPESEGTEPATHNAAHHG